MIFRRRCNWVIDHRPLSFLNGVTGTNRHEKTFQVQTIRMEGARADDVIILKEAGLRYKLADLFRKTHTDAL